jgi:hypothetical protein
MVEGYNIAFKIGTKTICGRTQDDLTIAARLTESITKDDAGDAQVTVTGQDVTFSASGMVEVGNSASTKMDRDDLMEQALKKGSNALIAFVYSATGGDTYTGNCIMTQYRESSNATDVATWQADFRVSGTMTKQA